MIIEKLSYNLLVDYIINYFFILYLGYEEIIMNLIIFVVFVIVVGLVVGFVFIGFGVG